MKKIIFLCWILVFAIGLPACGSQTESIVQKETSTPAISAAVSSPPARQTVSSLTLEAKYDCELGSIQFQLPQDGIFDIEEYTDSNSKFGIHFRLDDRMDGCVSVLYDKQPFGVCGTGLEETDVTIHGMPARMGVYDNQPWWDFIALTDAYNGYVILTDNPDAWWTEYGDKVMEVLDTLTIHTESK